MAAILLSCPDCEFSTEDRDEFIAHREQQHPPTNLTLSPAGIESQERVHGD